MIDVRRYRFYRSNKKHGVNNPALPGCVVCSTVYDVFQSPEFVLHTPVAGDYQS